MNHLYQEEIGIIKAQKKSGEYVDTITLQKRIKEKKFTVQDIGVDYRWIDHWHSKGLLIGNYEDRKWRKFNLIEYVWLKMIIKMRGFNLSLETVKSVKDKLDIDITGDDLMKMSENSLMEIIPQIAPSDLESAARDLLREKEVQEKIMLTRINLIELFIMDILTLYSYYSILINPDGEIIPIKYSYLELYSDKMEFKNFITKSYVSISITEILRDFIEEKDIDLNNKKRLAILTEEESMVLKAIRQDDLKSVIIKFDNDNKMNLLEEIKEERIDKASRLFEMIMTKGYQDITIKTQNGEIVYCENKRKQLIQKKE
ncbi:MAG: MerR family transcriptional regulator [Bacteroidota bacterium]